MRADSSRVPLASSHSLLHRAQSNTGPPTRFQARHSAVSLATALFRRETCCPQASALTSVFDAVPRCHWAILAERKCVSVSTVSCPNRYLLLPAAASGLRSASVRLPTCPQLELLARPKSRERIELCILTFLRGAHMPTLRFDPSQLDVVLCSFRRSSIVQR